MLTDHLRSSRLLALPVVVHTVVGTFIARQLVRNEQASVKTQNKYSPATSLGVPQTTSSAKRPDRSFPQSPFLLAWRRCSSRSWEPGLLSSATLNHAAALGALPACCRTHRAIGTSHGRKRRTAHDAAACLWFGFRVLAGEHQSGKAGSAGPVQTSQQWFSWAMQRVGRNHPGTRQSGWSASPTPRMPGDVAVCCLPLQSATGY